MKLTDLELYRWKYHHDIYMNIKRVQDARKTSQRPSLFWKEFGAFVSVLPRQVGKTTMLQTIVNNLPESTPYIIVSPTSSMANSLMHNFKFPSANVYIVDRLLKQLPGISIGKVMNSYLLIDEFDYMRRGDLDNILNYYWKSVTMVSTLG